jgi:hypothetical protein
MVNNITFVTIHNVSVNNIRIGYIRKTESGKFYKFFPNPLTDIPSLRRANLEDLQQVISEQVVDMEEVKQRLTRAILFGFSI